MRYPNSTTTWNKNKTTTERRKLERGERGEEEEEDRKKKCVQLEDEVRKEMKIKIDNISRANKIQNSRHISSRLVRLDFLAPYKHFLGF